MEIERRQITIKQLVNTIKFKRIHHHSEMSHYRGLPSVALKEQALKQHQGNSFKDVWSSQELAQFCNLTKIYGSDYSLLQSFFPNRSRKQIRKKFIDLEKIRRQIERENQRSRRRELRRSFFEDEILEHKMIKWISKPNNSDGSSSSSNSDQGTDE